jgi:phosphoglycolate phosphatase
MRLVLFDIDETLIRSSRIGSKVVAHALTDVFGSAGPIGHLRFAGKTDLAIILDLMIAEGLAESEIRFNLPHVYQQMVVHARRFFPQAGLKACPGIGDLLKQIVNNGRILLGIQTGNINLTAQLKLQAAAIETEQFSIGAYGSDAIDRSDLIPIAWARAKRKTGRSFTGENTIVIGDTPADVDCAKVNGAISVAVATGSYSGADLAKSGPTYLLDDLVDLPLSLISLLN